ncbi:MAG: DUF4296 domain-containing protein [Flavobacteriales bacterium]
MKPSLYIAILTGLISCSYSGEKNLSVPSISEENFIEILVDVNLLESHLGFLRIDPEFAIDSAKIYYAYIFEKHGVTQQEYEDNLKIYTDDPVHFQTMQQLVLEKLHKMDAEFTDVEYSPEKFSALGLPDLVYILIDLKTESIVLNNSLTPIQVRDSLLNFVKDKENILEQDNTNFYQFKNTLNNWVTNTLRFNQLKNALEESLKEE